MARRIKLEKVENFRDLGGYSCRYGKTHFGIIYRSATLCNASKSDLDAFSELGIKTVIDLRESETKKEFPDPTKEDSRFLTIELPVNGNGRIARDYQDYVDSYIEMLEDPESARNILKAIINAPKPLVIHCNAGKDRTGVFSMLLLLLSGVDEDDINADYMLSFPYLREMTIFTRANRKEVPELLLTPDIFFLHDVMKRFREIYRTPEEYCEAIGLSEEETDVLSSILGKHKQVAGQVVFKENKVLIERMAKGYYGLPKGKIEEGEIIDEAAFRETLEETGIRAAPLPCSPIYSVYSPKQGKISNATWFVSKALNEEIHVDGKEVLDAYWLSIEDALRTLSRGSDRSVLMKAANLYADFANKK